MKNVRIQITDMDTGETFVMLAHNEPPNTDMQIKSLQLGELKEDGDKFHLRVASMFLKSLVAQASKFNMEVKHMPRTEENREKLKKEGLHFTGDKA